MNKLRDDRGETLVEVLASILIASLSVALLFGCVMASANIDRQAQELDEDHYAGLSAAEARTGDHVDGTVKIVNPGNSMELPLDVVIYGGAGLYSYAREGT